MSDIPPLTSPPRQPNNSSRHLWLTSVCVVYVVLTLLMIRYSVLRDVDAIFQQSGLHTELEHSERNVSQLPFQYQSPPAAGVNQKKGILFTPDHDLIRRMGLPPRSYVTLTRETVRDFVFVTAADDSHFNESLDAIASVQHNFRGYQIHYYDLGLSTESIAKLKSLCNVHYHSFDLSVYPPCVRIDNIAWKCWKFIIIQDALRYHNAVFWMDASFRAVKNITEWSEIFSIALKTGGAVFCRVTIAPFTNFAYTDPRMYDYFPTDQARQKETFIAESGAVLLYNTRHTFDTILWWMYLCSLQGDCCPPSSTRHLSIGAGDDLDSYHDHRHDQSALNLLLSNYFGYDTRKYTSQISNSVFIRGPSDYYKVEKCG